MLFRSPVNRLLKRAFDLAVAVPVVALILPPLCGWVWLCQRRQAPGPLFHTRERCGRRGHEFPMLKFRTMRTVAPDAPAEAKQAVHEDARVFPLGRFMRRHSLDEFPQFWNVLVGDMSLVGPRPELVEVVERYEPWQHQRHLVKPGLTGLWQVSRRGEGLMYLYTDLDLEYISTMSFRSDVGILLKTLPAALSRSGS